MSADPTRPQVVVVVPCYDEEVAIGSVVRDLRAALPGARVVVVDNNSSDATAEVARAAGAEVRHEPRPGKGNAVRRAFADLEADVYLMIDGDATYEAAAAPRLVEALLAGPHDMVVGCRVPEEHDAYRPGHALGNRGFNLLVSRVFGSSVTDMLSGYRAFSRRFVKTFPAASTRFAIETELTVHAINHRMPVVEVPVGFRDRPAGSESKLSTVRDGLDILRTIVGLLHHERPLWLYPAPAALLLTAGLVTGGALSTLLLVLGASLLLAGTTLQSAGRGRREQLRAAYLQQAAPPHRLPVPLSAPVSALVAAASATPATPPEELVVLEAQAVAEVAAEVAAELGGEQPATEVADAVAPVLTDDDVETRSTGETSDAGPARRVVPLLHRAEREAARQGAEPVQPVQPPAVGEA
ncbi:glycosyltransferase [Nocardioides marmoraquaticus]